MPRALPPGSLNRWALCAAAATLMLQLRENRAKTAASHGRAAREPPGERWSARVRPAQRRKKPLRPSSVSGSPPAADVHQTQVAHHHLARDRRPAGGAVGQGEIRPARSAGCVHRVLPPTPWGHSSPGHGSQLSRQPKPWRAASTAEWRMPPPPPDRKAPVPLRVERVGPERWRLPGALAATHGLVDTHATRRPASATARPGGSSGGCTSPARRRSELRHSRPAAAADAQQARRMQAGPAPRMQPQQAALRGPSYSCRRQQAARSVLGGRRQAQRRQQQAGQQMGQQRWGMPGQQATNRAASGVTRRLGPGWLRDGTAV